MSLSMAGVMLICFTLFENVSSKLMHLPEENSNDATMVNAVVSIIKHFLSGNVIYISNYAANKSELNTQNYLLSNVLSKIDRSTWFLETMQQVPSVYVKFNNLIFIDSYSAFRMLYKDLANVTTYDASGFYLIILTNPDDWHYSTMQKMFSDCWSLFIVNIYIIVSSPSNQILLYTYFPYQSGQCGSTTPIVINRFENNSFAHTLLYHSKATNLYQCLLNVITWENPPFILLNRTENGSVVFNGIEGKLLRTVAAQLNFTVGYVPAPKINPRGYIFDNGSMTGSFEMLRRGEANLTLGCFRYSEIRIRNFASTHPYFQAPIVVALSRGLSLTALERFLYPFTGSLWGCLIVLYFISILIITVLRCLGKYAESFILGPNNSTPMYNMWTSFLGGQANNPPMRNFARFILTLWLVFSLVIRGSYQGELYNFLRLNIEERLPNHLADLVVGDFRIHVDPPTEDIIQTNPYLRKVSFVSNESQHIFLQRLQRGMRKYGILCPLAYVSYANSVNFGKEPLYVMKERVLVQPNCIYFQKSSPLAKPISKLLWQYSTSGLLNSWSDEFTASVESSSRRQSKKALVPKQFTNENLTGAYEVYGMFIAVSCLVFLIEIMSTFSAKLRRCFYNNLL